MRWRRSSSVLRAADRTVAALALGAALVSGCAEAPSRPVALRVPVAELGYLLPPTAGAPQTPDPGLVAALDGLYRRLVSEGATASLRREAALLAEQRPDSGVLQVLLAQIELAGGDPDGAWRRLEPLLPGWPAYAAAQLVAGRAAELLNDLPAAFAAYRRIAGTVPLAAERVAELRQRALEIVANRLDDALLRGDLQRADAEMERLDAWAPEAIGTLQASRRLAVARGDAEAELAVVRELRRRQPADPELRDRLATLEVAAGDPGAGINILQEIAAEQPDDTAIARRLAHARFRWRLVLLPEEVRATTRSPELTRGEVAALIYWLFPTVRYARPQTARIASDIFDHGFREEIVRVINLDLMEVDDGLHVFGPGEPVTRVETLGAILRAVAASRPEEACLGPIAARQRLSWPIVCGAAASCGLIPAEADCLPGAALSGAEAVALSERAQQMLSSE